MAVVRGRWVRASVFFALIHFAAVAFLFFYALATTNLLWPEYGDALRVLAFALYLLPDSVTSCWFGLVLVVANSVLWGMALATIYVGLALATAYVRQRLARY